MLSKRRLKIDKDSIAIRVGFVIGIIILSVIIYAIINVILFQSNRSRINDVSNIGIPTAVISVQMIGEIDDINSNVLEYILGEIEEEEEFEENKDEFLEYLNIVDESNNFKESDIRIIEDLFNRYALALRAGVFNLYRPEDEKWAKDRVRALTSFTSLNLDNILEELSNNKIGKNIRETDLPSVRYYLTLIDKAGDIIRDLNEYVEGDPSGKERFFRDTQSFAESFELLKPLEKGEYEANKLLEVNAYYKVIRDGGLEVFSGYNPSNKIEAISNLETVEYHLLNELERMLDDLGKKAKEKAFISLGDLNRQNNLTISILLTLLTIVLLFSLFLMFYFYNSVSKPVNKVSNAMRELAEGNTEFKLNLYNQKGEIQILGDSFEIFRENIREREKVEKALHREKEKAEVANRSKSDFLSNMSHEIRTPMNSVLGFSDLLRGIVKDSQGISYLDSITKSGKTLLKLINDILDLSKIEAGKLIVQESEVEFRPYMEEIKNDFITRVKAKGLDFNVYISPGFPDYIVIDEIRLKQVIVNIIDNAIKFTKNGYISISAEAIFTEGNEIEEFNISIEDSGLGIPKDSQNKVFEAFVQKEGQLYSQFGGTGLGLAISQRIVRAMGGYIELESQVGKGSKFIIHIPEAKGRNIEISEDEDLTIQEKEFIGSSVLIADDVASNKVLIEGYLKGCNLKLRYASNGREVIDICKLDPPDLILLDMRMPKMDGYSAAKILNENPEYRKIPKIAVTASAMVEDKEAILEVCDEYISKPIDQDELFKALYKFLPTKSLPETNLSKRDFNGIDRNTLNEWKNKLEHFVEIMNIEKIKKTSKLIITSCEEVESYGLKIWAEILRNYCDELDVRGIKRHIDLFLDIIKLI